MTKEDIRLAIRAAEQELKRLGERVQQADGELTPLASAKILIGLDKLQNQARRLTAAVGKE